MRMPRLLVLAAIIIACLPARFAAAQGTDGALPSPVTTSELERYGDRLQLSEQQRLALQSAHDEYKRVFRELRDGDIADFLKKQRGLMGSLPEREIVEDIFVSLERLLEKIERLDQRLFDAVEPMLTEAQLAALPRVRLARERMRYESQQMMWITGRPPANLEELIEPLELEPATRAMIAPALEQYERQMVAEMRKLSAISGRMYMDLFDGLERKGLADLSREQVLQDPAMMQKIFVAVQELWGEISGRVTSIVADLSELNHRSFQAVATLLPEEEKAELRRQFYEREFPRSHELSYGAPPLIRNQRELKRLVRETQDAIQEALATYQRQVDALGEEAVPLELAGRSSFSPFGNANPERTEKFKKLRDRRDEIYTRTQTTLQTLTGETYARLIEEPKEDEPLDSAVAPVPLLESALVVDAFLAPTLTRPDVSAIAKSLGLDDGRREIAYELFRTYKSRINGLDETKRLQEHVQKMRRPAEDGGGSTEADITRVFQLRREVALAIEAAETAFFADLAIGVAETDEEVRAVGRQRQRRLRNFLAHGAGDLRGALGAIRTTEHTIDLYEVVERAELTDDERRRLEEALDAYDDAALAPHRARFDTQLELREGFDRWSAAASRGRGDGDLGPDQTASFRQTLQPVARRLESASEAVATVNRTARDELLARLPGDAARRLRRAYNLAAFPGVYRDETSVDEPLALAMRLTDITPDQRERLIDLVAEYRPEYERLSQTLVELSAAGSFSALAFDAASWEAFSARNAKYQKVLFDRSELNLRAIGRLAGILTPSQVERVGGLPETS